jgi:hypothetical protein
MVVENRHRNITISSIEGLEVLASSTSLTSPLPSPSVYEYLREKVSRGNTLVTEYLALSVKAISGYFDTLFAKEIHTDKVCIKKSNGTDVCLTGDQVETMLNTSQIPLMTPQQGNGGNSGGAENSTTTEPTNGTTTPEIDGTTEPPSVDTSSSTEGGGSSEPITEGEESTTSSSTGESEASPVLNP